MMRFLSTSRKFYFVLAVLLISSCRGNKEVTNDSKNASAKKIRSTYAALLGVEDNKIENIKLYSFIDEWYGTPYKYAGKDKNGIDCSDLVSRLYKDVFARTVSPPAHSIYKSCKTFSKDKLEEGDLVFFKIGSEKVSHIGVYLQNGKFVHAGTTKGVVINSLDENYYKKYFYKGGRLN